MAAPSNNPLASAALITWNRNAAYGLRLVGDLEPEQWMAQPLSERVMNHPAWIFSHLNLYGSIAVRLARGESFDDPAEHRYGQRSEPQSAQDAYSSPKELMALWSSVHADAAEALAECAPDLTSAANPLPRWRSMHPTVGDMLIALIVKHESAHLGQLSAWRRAMGLGRVPM